MSVRAASSCWDASTASANICGANALIPSSAYMYQTRGGPPGLLGTHTRDDHAGHVVDGDPVAGDEELTLGGEVLVQELRRDAELGDDIGHARALVAMLGEAAGGGAQDRVPRLLVAAGVEIYPRSRPPS